MLILTVKIVKTVMNAFMPITIDPAKIVIYKLYQ